jgi:hypothetical protein
VAQNEWYQPHKAAATAFRLRQWRRRLKATIVHLQAEHARRMSTYGQLHADWAINGCCYAIRAWQPLIDEARREGVQEIAVEAEGHLIQALRGFLEVWGQPTDDATIDELRARLTRQALATSAATTAEA